MPCLKMVIKNCALEPCGTERGQTFFGSPTDIFWLRACILVTITWYTLQNSVDVFFETSLPIIFRIPRIPVGGARVLYPGEIVSS